MTDALVAASRASIEKGSKSFALASRLFEPVLRDRATLLYAWCRYADDVIDGQDAGYGRVEYAGTPAERLAALEAGTRLALSAGRDSSTHSLIRHPGEGRDPPSSATRNSELATTVGPGLRRDDDQGVERETRDDDQGVGEATNLPFAALARVAADTAMPERYPLDLIEGFRSDVEERAFITFDDTLTYCYHVAGCVGVMMAIVMGVPPGDRATLDRACDLGMAFQLNNIARDVVEDAANGRCYLPAIWLAEAGLTQATYASPEYRAALATVVARLVDEAERYEASSRFGTPALTRRAAWAVLAAADIYGGIGRKVRAEGAAALDHRVTTSRAEKLWAVARTLPLSFSRARRWPAPGPSRAGLWTRPYPATT
ncbi:phytoene/squalene synthase family protein [Polymorphobacter sp. PAMC 29334]|uniref:phytoene/squalene synthase family protein n=1 Tax=Polymorphobacter sp. PAMC 29334 TaxID=2862331 RepID=UPI001C681C5C|nr:phytoene/squalene synthase family protein [Polymorphobacter sp. PAMC 29334]QYE34372.1 phytoene/squalene synthase family protein [Polymorphobacter sp. PAMC 29334]